MTSRDDDKRGPQRGRTKTSTDEERVRMTTSKHGRKAMTRSEHERQATTKSEHGRQRACTKSEHGRPATESEHGRRGASTNDEERAQTTSNDRERRGRRGASTTTSKHNDEQARCKGGQQRVRTTDGCGRRTQSMSKEDRRQETRTRRTDGGRWDGHDDVHGPSIASSSTVCLHIREDERARTGGRAMRGTTGEDGRTTGGREWMLSSSCFSHSLLRRGRAAEDERTCRQVWSPSLVLLSNGTVHRGALVVIILPG
ncbi:hypothetical protein BDN70DRAFT_900504 [Pholiota conissans]|uniref:Uncharacterized protein n=1 Tax=Pholiota conissans TaxID=109636 RepID=A0A9P5YNM3_9AGAR|nr:hypothetical protein BDN70DRAFT_900504 [Pholiota conissans]